MKNIYNLINAVNLRFNGLDLNAFPFYIHFIHKSERQTAKSDIPQ